MPVTGWKLDRNVRAQLLERFPPTWPDVIADHVTLQAGASANEPLPAQEAAEIVGKVDDGEGLQALIVSIDGRSEEHTSELQSLMRISYSVFSLRKKTRHKQQRN